MLTVHAADMLFPGSGQQAVSGGALAVEGRRIAALGPYADVAAAFPAARVRRWPGLLTPGLCHPRGSELLTRAYHPDPREADELGTEPLTGDALAALTMTGTRWGGSARRGVQRLLAHGVVALRAPDGDAPWPGFVRDAVRRAGLLVRERSGRADEAGDGGAWGGGAWGDGGPGGVRGGSVPDGGVSGGGVPDCGVPDSGVPLLDPLRGRPPAEVAAAFGPALSAEGEARADFAVFDLAVPGPVQGQGPGAGGSTGGPSAGDVYAALAAHGARCCVATVLGGRLVHRRV